jgi:alpha-galactosidase
MNSGFTIKPQETQKVESWIAGLGNSNKVGVHVVSWKQGWGKLGFSRSIINTPLCLGGKKYDWGFGTHADSEIILRSNKPIKLFRARVGVDYNKDSKDLSKASLVFSVWAGEKMFAESRPLDIKSLPERMEVQMNGETEFALKVKAQNTIALAHADWVEAEVVTTDGETIRIGTQETIFVDNILPVSFRYNGMDSRAWFQKWGIVHTQAEGNEFTTHKYVCADKDTGLECTFELQNYKSFPSCLWNIYFKNNSKTVTPILEQVKTLDLFWLASDQKNLYRAHGAFHYENETMNGEAFRDDFMLVRDDLNKINEINLSADGGRSSVEWMPYLNFAGKNEGLIFGIGWTGQWQSTIKSDIEAVHFQAGMEKIHTVLNPGETIRQPSILMIYWQGDDPIRGHNLLRRFMTNVIMPHYAGKPVQAPISYGSWGGMPTAEHLKRIANIKKQKLLCDYYWIDAGWYGPDEEKVNYDQWSIYVGMWKINAKIHPQGLKPISDAAHQAGMKFLLWFEPERAIQGMSLTLDHPDWFLGEKKEGANLLLNLGNPEARKGITDLIADIIQKEGIDCYRQDFNFSPLPYWQSNDTPDRIGMTEIRHVEGLYAFWDELRQRFPNLLIDNCASGGRRLDFEMMRRSIPLWASDMMCFPGYITERYQQQVSGLSMWIPQFSFGTDCKHAGGTYHFRSTMAGGTVLQLFGGTTDPIDPEYPYQWLRDRLEENHRAKPYFSGDYYPLMKQSGSFEDWSIFQFDRPDLGGGFLEYFRKKDSPIEKVCPKLCGLNSSAIYEIEDADSKQTFKVSGQELMEKGWPVEIVNRCDSRLFFYHLANTTKE